VSQSDNWDNISDSRPGCHTHGVSRLAYKKDGMLVLREMFPGATTSPGRFILFPNTSFNGGVTIEDFEGDVDIVTRAQGIAFLIIRPQTHSMQTGTVSPVTPDDFDFLKKLRQSSWDAVCMIGKGQV
jgi:hypothetical protein